MRTAVCWRGAVWVRNTAKLKARRCCRTDRSSSPMKARVGGRCWRGILAVMTRFLVSLLATLLFCIAPAAHAQSEWDGVARVVVFGDLHGDYAKFEDMLTQAGLIDAQGHWSGGQTHLVQVGDVPDRAPD